MKHSDTSKSVLSFYLDSKLHEDLRIRLHYDQVKNQSHFFRMCVESYLAQDELFMEFFEDRKINNKVQSKARTQKSRKLRDKGNKLMEQLALSHDEVENIFDILEEDLPEL
tara:strand:+ start:333 stop:665 length:333 start_codon:yes stop_codon:yes gene_type:complete